MGTTTWILFGVLSLTILSSHFYLLLKILATHTSNGHLHVQCLKCVSCSGHSTELRTREPKGTLSIPAWMFYRNSTSSRLNNFSSFPEYLSRLCFKHTISLHLQYPTFMEKGWFKKKIYLALSMPFTTMSMWVLPSWGYYRRFRVGWHPPKLPLCSSA